MIISYVNSLLVSITILLPLHRLCKTLIRCSGNLLSAMLSITGLLWPYQKPFHNQWMLGETPVWSIFSFDNLPQSKNIVSKDLSFGKPACSSNKIMSEILWSLSLNNHYIVCMLYSIHWWADRMNIVSSTLLQLHILTNIC